MAQTAELEEWLRSLPDVPVSVHHDQTEISSIKPVRILNSMSAPNKNQP